MPVMNATFLAIATVRGQRRSPATSLEFQDFGISYSDYRIQKVHAVIYFFFLVEVLLKTKGVAIIDTAG